MDELKKFILLVWKYRLIIVIVPLITIMVTFFIVRNLPDVYWSEAQIATGIVDETQQMSFTDDAMLQDSRINQKFINMIEVMRSKSMLILVSYKLMLHDLTAKPFKEKSPLLKELNDDAIKHAIEVFREKYQKKESLNLRDPDQKGLYSVLQSMEYDDESLKSSLSVYRLGATDFINLDYTSESADLSAFVVNTLSDEFTNYYTTLVKANQRSSVKFLENLLNQKSDTLQNRIANLRSYKIRNRILNLNEQSSQIMTQSADYEFRIQQAEKDIISYRGAISNIDKRFDPQDRRYFESTLTDINQNILSTRAEIHSLYDKYVQNDFDETYKKSIDSLQRVITSQINSQSDKYIYNPLNTKQDLVQQKLNLQLQLDLAAYGLNSLKRHLNFIGRKFDNLVPHEAVIQSFDRNIETVSKEYQDLLTQYNQIKMESEFPIKLRQVLVAMPGLPQPSKKMLLVLLSGIISGAFCLLVFFVMFYLDDRIRRPMELAAATKIPVLGYLNLVGKRTLDLKGIWKNLHGTAEMKEFKKQLRSTRFEVNKELAISGNRGSILNITSIGEGEGKTLIAACIAYTYVMVSKKVLLIDGNFDHASVTENSNTKLFIEDYLKTGEIPGSDFLAGIMVMGNRGGDKSLFELADEKVIKDRLEQLRSIFDVIIVETPPLESLNKAKEWILFSDKTLSVFQADQSITAAKKQHIHYLQTINGKFIGWVLNKVKPEGKVTEQIELATVVE
ncbi:lipopolysaccharide biosynthesis protein [Daejeonella sp.]|uniref:exopolysaccharide transport family protein n=1 Tax=Daejeonella sp. TaxID=2805397 RepID=UPI0030C5F0F5